MLIFIWSNNKNTQTRKALRSTDGMPKKNDGEPSVSADGVPLLIRSVGLKG